METYAKRNYCKAIVKKLESGLACLLVICLLVTALLSAPSSASADVKLDEVAVGNLPIAVAVNPVTNKIYVVNQSSNEVTVIDGATHTTTPVTVGNGPQAVAVNPVTNKIYVANQNSNDVTVIDGATNMTTQVQVGVRPTAVSLNSVTNKIYVANSDSGTVTVIDGATHTTTPVTVGHGPQAVAVNPVTNKIYVANSDSDNVTVIDGATDTPTQVQVGINPTAVAVNPVTNKIYVANSDSDNVTVIDGATDTPTPVQVGTNPTAVAVNPVTNKIYVANSGSGNVTVIDGTTDTTTPVTVGNGPQAVAVNAVTNKIYVTNTSSNDVTVIDGATHTTTLVQVGTIPTAVAVNSVTNKIYVANTYSNDVTAIDGVTNSTTSVQAGPYPSAVAVNPVTNKIYVANSGSGNVTVIDGTTDTPTTVPVGDNPVAVAVNTVTNKIYVVNEDSGDVTVIDGATHTTTLVTVGNGPKAVAVNSVTNKIYVANGGSGTVTVIDGTTDTTTQVTVGNSPQAVAVNPVTNKIYVSTGNDVTVIDGATDTPTTSVQAGTSPFAIAVNPVTNKIYVANHFSHNVTVIDGANNTTMTVPVGSYPHKVAVNSVTNKIYVANTFSYDVTVIDGATNATTTVATGSTAVALAVNPVTNKIYAAIGNNNNMKVIDGVTNMTTTVVTGEYPQVVAVNPVTNKIYVGNGLDGSVTVIDDARRTPNPLKVEVTPLPDNIAYGTDATFTFQVTNGYSPNASVVHSVYFQLDTIQGPWVHANPSGSNWTATVSSLTYGKHDLFVLALEAQGDGVPAGVANAYSFYSVPPNSITPTSASFDIRTGSAGHTDVSTTLALNGNTLTSIANGATNLASGTDYTVSGNTITISKAYLAAQTVGTTTLTFTFSGGATQTLAITVSDSNPTISPTSASFDKYTGSAGHADVSTTLALGGDTLTSIANGAANLAAGTDYTVSGNTITISKTYLAAQSVGTTTLTFTFSGGATQMLAITVSDSNPTISPTSASFDKYTGSAGHTDVSTTLALGGDTLTSIANGAANLAAGTDYTVSGNTITVSKAYLVAKSVGTTSLTFTFSGGATQTLAITVSDSTPTISPTSASFDKYTGSAGHTDVSTTLALGGDTLTSIANGAANLASGTDYTVSGNTITISKTYLAAQTVGTTTLTFTFSGGAAQTLAITVSDSTPPTPGVPVLGPATPGDARISLTWDSVIGSTGYKIFKSTTSGAYGSEEASVSGSVYGYDVMGLTNGTTYYFVIQATNPGGDSTASNEVSATPRTVPSAPTGITAVAGNGQATVSFTAPANGGSDITYYEVTAMPGNITVTGAGSPITVTGLSNGVTYTFTVQAINSAGSSLASEASNAVTPRQPSGSTNTSTPTTAPDPAPTPGSPEPTVDVFNSSIVNEANLVKTIESKVAEAKEANAAIDFADTQGHWAEKTIDVFIKLQLINGYDDGTFRPNNPITRAEFATMLNRVFQIQGGSNTSTELKDIDDSWAKDDIENLVAAGVINGYADGTFKPNQTITREEMVVMLSRIVNLNSLEKDTTKGNFNDLDDAYAAEEIQAAAQASIVSGKGDGVFDPKSNATRAEALEIILNVLELNPQLKTLLDSLS